MVCFGVMGNVAAFHQKNTDALNQIIMELHTSDVPFNVYDLYLF
jgi:hypothetical protein